jgi:hypothetical protein
LGYAKLRCTEFWHFTGCSVKLHALVGGLETSDLDLDHTVRRHGRDGVSHMKAEAQPRLTKDFPERNFAADSKNYLKSSEN